MGQILADKLGMASAPMTLERSVAGIVQLLDESTRDTHGGKMWRVGNDSIALIPW